VSGVWGGSIGSPRSPHGGRVHHAHAPRRFALRRSDGPSLTGRSLTGRSLTGPLRTVAAAPHPH